MDNIIDSNKKLKKYYRVCLKAESTAPPRCSHFGECGGCALQKFRYEDQLDIKRIALTSILSPIISDGVELIGSKHQFGYRQRMDYVVTHNPIHEPHDRIGLRKRGNFNHVIDLDECYLIPVEWLPKLRRLFELAGSLEIPNYDLVPHTGDLRYFVIRQAGVNAMLSIVTKSEEYAEQVEQLALSALELGFTTVYWLLQPKLSDVSFGEIQKHWGEKHLSVPLQFDESEFRFSIGPNTFFQNNIQAFGKLLEYVSEQIEEHATSRTVLLDLYSGVGTIGISLASGFDKVIGIELNKDSVDLAAENAKQNEIKNVEYFADSFEKFSMYVDKQDFGNTVAILDPPRIGLEEAGVSELRVLNPSLIVYISCNPITQVRDIQQLPEYGIVSQRGFDMFPQTLHMENVIVLKRL